MMLSPSFVAEEHKVMMQMYVLPEVNGGSRK